MAMIANKKPFFSAVRRLKARLVKARIGRIEGKIRKLKKIVEADEMAAKAEYSKRSGPRHYYWEPYRAKLRKRAQKAQAKIALLQKKKMLAMQN